jgi:hypothetical protein
MDEGLVLSDVVKAVSRAHNRRSKKAVFVVR